MTSSIKEQHEATGGKFFTFFVDGKEYHVNEPTINGGEIMAMAEIPLEAGLLLIEDDGTQRQADAGEQFELRPGRRFKKAPRFKRG